MKIVKLLALIVAASAALSGLAQDYPGRPVRVIVPFSAGSGTDIVARTFSQKLGELWGQSIVVDNRTGAGGTIAAGIAAKATADGYTLLVHSSAYAVNATFYAPLPYDPLRDFVGIAPLGKTAYVLVVGPSARVKTVGDLIAAAKAKPGQLSFGSAGMGSGTHMVAEKFRLAAGIDIVHVPYKGGPEATTDTMTGRVTYWFPPVALALPHVHGGKLLALGVSSAQRSSLLPNVPTIAEAGIANFEDTLWFGIWAPAAVPRDLLAKMARDAARALAAPDLRDRFTKLAVEPMTMTPPEFARFVRSEIEGTARVIKVAGIKPQ